ncbi:MAG: HD domain-containing protein [Nitrospirae bacterium]|nr:HD domain-containing protein [Nitrospirota bacterium]
MLEKFLKFLSYIVTAMAQCSLYSNEHPAVIELSEKAFAIMDELYINDSLSITLLGGMVIFNDITVREKGIYMEKFMKRLKARGIEKIIIRRGIRAEEITRFIIRMASRDESPVSSDHIVVGTVHVKFKSTEEDVSTVMDANIPKLKDIFQDVSRFKKLDTAALEDAVLSFISAIKKEANVLRILSHVKSHSEYTYVHSSNSAVLTIFQAEHLGLKGENLREAAIAGLLHDVGKMFVSKEILHKQTGLNEMEWNEIKRHPVYGAMYLSSLNDISRLATIAAFEHHLKFDGSGYPDTKWRSRKQHIVSQIVAISDSFDVLRINKPYGEGLEVNTLVGFLKKSAGKDFNPVLVDNFVSALKKIGAF